MSAAPATLQRRATSSLDPFSPAFRADPFRCYAELRALGPLVWLEAHEVWAVQHHAQARAVLTDWETFGNTGGAGLANHHIDKPWRPPSLVLEVDPPQHTRARTVLARVLSPLALKAMRGHFEVAARQLIDAALDKGEVEAIEELVQPYPLRIFGDAVGMPPLDRDIMLRYGAMVFGAMGPQTDWYRDLMGDAEAVGAWIDARCERSALSPDGLGAAIYAAADTGEVTLEEAKRLVRSLLSAGVDTTIDSLGLALRCLVDNPDQLALLRRDPALARAAFEEATRFDASSHLLFRTTSRAIEFEGQAIDRHAKVAVFIASAGRDPAHWGPDADLFRIQRRITAPMGYGVGVHGCVAQMMARLEAEVFFRVFAEKVGTCEAAGPAQLRLTPGLRGLAKLPLRLSRA